jgi:hypothetical protein
MNCYALNQLGKYDEHSLAVWFCSSITRWCNYIMVVIAKDPGSSKIERIRVIHLFEADYNFTLKLLWESD